jgi:hypothetical protein
MDCWHDEIEAAESEADIVRNACEYLLLWAPRELHPHTLGLYDMRVRSYLDIESVNIHLADLPAAGDSRLREIADYFWHAASRISELRYEAKLLPPMVPVQRAPSQSLRPRP